jgi:hypothetical protein
VSIGGSVKEQIWQKNVSSKRQDIREHTSCICGCGGSGGGSIAIDTREELQGLAKIIDKVGRKSNVDSVG